MLTTEVHFMRLPNFIKGKKGQIGFQSVALTLGVVAILLLIIVLIFSKVGGSIDQTDMTAAENSSIDNIKSTTLDSIDLVVIGLVVLAAVAILGVLFMLGRRA